MNKWAAVLRQHVPAGRGIFPATGRGDPDDGTDIVPIIIQAGFDPIWFGVILIVEHGIGLITPPVGLNLYVINGIVNDVDLKTVL